MFGLPTRVWVEFFDEFSLRAVGRTLTYAYMYPDALAVCCLFGPASSIRQQLDQLDLALGEAYVGV